MAWGKVANATKIVKAEKARVADAAYVAANRALPPSHILSAVRGGDLAQVQILCAAGPAAVNVEDADGCNPLSAAVCASDGAIVRCLLESGASVDARPRGFGPAALYQSVLRRDLEIAEILLGFGADVNLTDDPVNRRTALHAAIEAADEPLVAMLLEYGAAPHQKDVESKSPLMLANELAGTDRGSFIAELVSKSKNTWNSLLSGRHGPSVRTLRQMSALKGNHHAREVKMRAGQAVTHLRYPESIGQIDQRTMDRLVGPRASDSYGASLLRAASVKL